MTQQIENLELLPPDQAQNVAPVNFTSFPMPDRAPDAERYASSGMSEEFVALAIGGLVTADSDHRQEKVNMHKDKIALEGEREIAEHIANTDELTHMNNRRGFRKDMESALELARANHDDRWSLFFLDLDGFKGVNDSFGHETGDEYLKAIADKLKLRTEDIIGRIGGDEFVVFAKTSNEKNGRRRVNVSEKVAKAGIKKKIRSSVEAGAKVAEELTNTIGSNVSASIGEVPYTGVETVDELLNIADKLMLQEKRSRKLRR